MARDDQWLRADRPSPTRLPSAYRHRKIPAAPSSPLRIKISRIRFAQVGRSSYFSRSPYGVLNELDDQIEHLRSCVNDRTGAPQLVPGDADLKTGEAEIQGAPGDALEAMLSKRRLVK